MTLTERLKEISERAEKATPGSWSTGGPYNRSVWNNPNNRVAVACSDTYLGDTEASDNASFIAHSRTDIPDLVEMLKVAVGALDSYSRMSPTDLREHSFYTSFANTTLTRLDEIARRWK